MMTHELKTWPEYFYDVYAGDKTFEVRRNDRDFSVGDTLLLREYDPRSNEYSGRCIMCTVSYVLKDYPALQSGYVVMGFRSIKLYQVNDIRINFDGVWADAILYQKDTAETTIHVKITDDIAEYVSKWFDQTFNNDNRSIMYGSVICRNLTITKKDETAHLHMCSIRSFDWDSNEMELSFMAYLRVPSDVEIAEYESTKQK